MKIQENILLKDFTTFKVGGRAKYFAVIKSVDDLKQTVGFAERNQLSVFVLGGGSNLLVSDKGVDGLVLKMEIKGVSLRLKNQKQSPGFWTPPRSDRKSGCLANPGSVFDFSNGNPEIIQVIASAGEIWDDIVAQTVEKGFYGLENLSFIPGTVGASVVQNIGAYGVEIKDVVDWVEVYDTKTEEIKKFTGRACKFGYRDSIFKKPEGKNLVVIRVAYNLQKNGKLNTDYKDIQDYQKNRNPVPECLEKNQGPGPCFLNIETSHQLREIIIDIRKSKLPDWTKIGTAGSFFKNPIITKEQLDKIISQHPNLPHYKSWESDSQLFKISLAYVLDKILGLKGLEENGVGLYENQPLVIVNKGEAKTEDIKNFAQKIQKRVKDELGITIDFEVVEW
jgi:UDP-N-acetylmuramate dehydrogenase